MLTYLFREVLLDYVVRQLVDIYIFVVLQCLDLIQPYNYVKEYVLALSYNHIFEDGQIDSPPHSSINVATESRSGPGAAMRRMFDMPSKTT